MNNQHNPAPIIRFTEEADADLAAFYASLGSTTTKQKINAHALNNGGLGNFSTEDQQCILGALEYEYLINKGLIKPTLV